MSIFQNIVFKFCLFQIQAFQSYKGFDVIDIDGIVGKKTWEVIWPIVAAIKGDQGWHIMAVAERLRSLGAELLPRSNNGTTIYGDVLQEYVKDFQEDRYFPKDGSVTTTMLEAILR